jgi:hypothetical protein
MKKTYQITFKAELTEDDLNAMQSCFYQAMNESMEIEDVWGLEITEDGKDADDEIPDIEEAQKYTMHWEDVVDGLYACKTIDEVNKFLDNIPCKFGEWWVDTVGEGEDAHYEVTNEWFDTINEEPCSRIFYLEIKVEEDA